MQKTVLNKENIKEDFISLLNSMSPQEINEYIKSKGKPPKSIRPILVLKDLHL